MNKARLSMTLALLLVVAGLYFSYQRADAQTPGVPPIPIVSGATLKGEIKTPGQMDSYTFDGSVGDSVVISITGPTSLELFGPKGESLAKDSSRIDLVLKANGTHTIMVKASSTSTGSYTLSFKKVSGGVGVPIASGATLKGEIKLKGQMDWYTFQGNTGDVVIIRIVETSNTDLYPALELFGPAGEKLKDGTSLPSREARIDVTLKATGSNTIMVRADSYFGSTGLYNLSFKKASEGAGTPIASGDTLKGEIKLKGQMDWYTFVGNTGDVVIIRIVETSNTDLYPALELFGPAGEKLKDGTSLPSREARIDVTLKANGSNTIMVRAASYFGSTGLYNLSYKNVTQDARATPAPGTAAASAPPGDTLLAQKANLTNGAASGDLKGTFSFTNLEFVSLKTGPFSGKGSVKGDWMATLEGVSYTGGFTGMSFLKVSEGRVYMKGATSGQLAGVVEGYLTESVAASGHYDTFSAIWRIGKASDKKISAGVELTGTIAYGQPVEYASTQVRATQTSVKATTSGDYTLPLNAIVTQVQVTDKSSPYEGEGFSIFSFTADSGSGEGWAYAKATSDKVTQLNGLLSTPLLGIVSGKLDASTSPPSLSLPLRPAPPARLVKPGKLPRWLQL